MTDNDKELVYNFLKKKGHGIGKRKLTAFARKKFTNKIGLYKLNQIVNDYIKDNNFRPVSYKYFTAKQFNNFIGGWYCDLVYPRGKEPGTNQACNYYYVVFLNANSKYVWWKKAQNKDNNTLAMITVAFAEWCDAINVKHCYFKADMEKGLTPMGVFQQFNAGKEHHKFGPIDGFVSNARVWAEKNGYTGLPEQAMRTYVDKVWNKSVIKGIYNPNSETNHQTTRKEMLLNEDLEECFICKGLYKNIDKQEAKRELEGKQVEVFKPNKKGTFERRHSKSLPGDWQVEGVCDNEVKIINEKGEKKKVYLNQIRGIKEPLKENPKLKKRRIHNLLQTKPIIANGLEAYEKIYKEMEDELLKKVLKKINKRYEQDLANGMAPPTKLNEITEMIENGKKEQEKEDNSYRIGYQKSLSTIKKSALKSLSSKLLNIMEAVEQDTPHTNADGEVMLKGGEKLLKRKRKDNGEPNRLLLLPQQ
jgi:hypothetical protein